jgi:rfaE bifunctional protein kinase chain/domain
MIFEDYNKGILTERIIGETVKLCKETGVITAIDPKRKNFFSYQGADIFKPNLVEVKQALNILFDEITDSLLRKIHLELKNILEHKISFITLSDKGVFYQKDGNASVIPSHLRNIADVSGAGDTVIAVAALVYTATQNVHLMAEVANIAGGLVCEEVGTVAIDKSKLQNECELLLS